MPKAPGKSQREGMVVIELTKTFLDEGAAHEWFGAHARPDGRYREPARGVR